MGLIRELFFGGAKLAENQMSEWVTEEVVEEDGNKTEILSFKAKKLHARAIKIYETKVEIKDNTHILVKNKHGEFSFLKSDIANIETKMSFIFSTFYTILSVLVGCAMLATGVGIPLGILLFAIPFMTALIRSIKIKLKNGQTVTVYYNLKKDSDILLSKLNA